MSQKSAVMTLRQARGDNRIGEIRGDWTEIKPCGIYGNGGYSYWLRRDGAYVNHYDGQGWGHRPWLAIDKQSFVEGRQPDAVQDSATMEDR